MAGRQEQSRYPVTTDPADAADPREVLRAELQALYAAAGPHVEAAACRGGVYRRQARPCAPRMTGVQRIVLTQMAAACGY